jgi:hypothetical protein
MKKKQRMYLSLPLPLLFPLLLSLCSKFSLFLSLPIFAKPRIAETYTVYRCSALLSLPPLLSLPCCLQKASNDPERGADDPERVISIVQKKQQRRSSQ